MTNKKIHIEVIYGLPHKQTLLSLEVPENTPVEQGIILSGIIDHYPEIDLTTDPVGVWNRVCGLSQQLKAGDRIEIYRPLLADPKDIRRRKAEEAKKAGKADPVTGGRLKKHNTS